MGWSDLPAELVAAIADRITGHADLGRFRSVCPSWRSASAAHAALRRVPLLLLPCQDYFSVSRRLWSLTDDRIVETPMPAARGRSFLFASTHGWTLGVAGDFSAALVHPFTGASAILPALPSSFRDKDEKILRDMMVQATLVTDVGYDLAVDIWSLGCTIIEMFDGKPPWSDLEGSVDNEIVLREPKTKKQSPGEGSIGILQKYPVPKCDIWFIKFS